MPARGVLAMLVPLRPFQLPLLSPPIALPSARSLVIALVDLVFRHAATPPARVVTWPASFMNIG